MELLAHTRMVMWEGGSLWVVDATRATTPTPRRTDPHAHHAIQVTLSLGGWFRLDIDGPEVRGDAVAVAPDATHVFEAEGLLALLFVEPESRTGRAISRTLFDGRDLASVPPAMLADFGARIAANFRGARTGGTRRSSNSDADWRPIWRAARSRMSPIPGCER